MKKLRRGEKREERGVKGRSGRVVRIRWVEEKGRKEGRKKGRKEEREN